jgi:hypothetical protein
LSVLITEGFSQSFKPFSALPRKRFAAAVLRVGERDAALSQHLLEVTVAHPIAAIPADRPEHDLTLEVTPLEV